MTRQDALFAAIEANPTPIVEAAIERLTLDRGRPTTETEWEIRFGRRGSLWIERNTGNWHDWENDVGGGSWKLAVYAGMEADDVTQLYNVEPGARLDRTRREALQQAAERKQQQRAKVLAAKRRLRRAEAERLLAGATPADPGDPAGRYFQGRGLIELTGVRFHPGPVIRTRRGQLRQLAPTALFAVTDRQGDLCAVHCVQLDAATGQRLRGRRAKLSIGNLTDGYVRFGPRSDVVCLGEGAETVASVHQVAPGWRCLAACSSIRLVDHDRDLAAARKIVLLAERGVEDRVRALGQQVASLFAGIDIALALVPAAVPGAKADMNDVLQVSPDLVCHALSAGQLERVSGKR